MSGTTRMTFPRSVLVAVLAVVLLAVAVMVWWPDSTDSTDSTVASTRPSVGDRVEVGTLPFESYKQSDSKSMEAPLPQGYVSVHTRFGRTLETDTGERRVLDGKARWVDMSWSPSQYESDHLAIWPGATERHLKEPPSKIILRVGGKDHVVADDVVSTGAVGSVSVAVADPRDVVVLVATAGRSPERAVPDGRNPGVRTDATEPRGCAWQGRSTSPSCQLGGVRSRDVVGLGTAPRKKEWLLVRGVRPHQRATVRGVGKPVKTSRRVPGSPLSETRAFLVPADRPARVQVHCPKTQPKSGDPAVATDQSTVCARFTVSDKKDG